MPQGNLSQDKHNKWMKEMETDVKTRQTVKKEGRKLSKAEFRVLLPERLNKLGEWLLNNREAWDCGDGKIILK